jgi:hypothetical protein
MNVVWSPLTLEKLGDAADLSPRIHMQKVNFTELITENQSKTMWIKAKKQTY